MSNELEAFLEYIQVTKALSKKSCEAYQSDLLQIEALTKKPLIALDTNATLEALSSYDNKRTLNRKLSALNSFFEFCFRSEFVQDRQKIKLAKIPKNLPKFLTYEQIQNGMKTIERETWMGRRDAALILFLYATGMRVTECLNMRREDIDGYWLRVRHGKGDKERLIPIAKEALALLRSYLSAVPFEKEQIWLNYTGRSLSRISAFKITQKYLGISPHVLRHSYATALILGGADLRIVQELLGHSSLLTTQVYTHIQKQNLQDTVLKHHPMA
ncbi:MAG: tyrosine-type recombinase/integrase [Thiovulaceae bacterium]|nr:tyrosine-type recombinase/integrase [Sulfurimonadaceae bacterium]